MVAVGYGSILCIAMAFYRYEEHSLHVMRGARVLQEDK